jgi:acyl-homoserine lactone acylase PvdQ
MRFRVIAALALPFLLAAAPARAADRLYNILPAGQYGGLPTTAHSTDQLPLYDGLTPLAGNVTDADITRFFKPETLGPVGATTVEPTPRAGLTILRDSFGVPHITGKTRDDVSWGAGFVSGEDRNLLLQLGRGPARAAVADVPGLNAFGLVTSGKSFTPSAQTNRLVASERKAVIRAYGKDGRAMLHDFAVYAQGVTAGLATHGVNTTWTVDDVIATNAFIGSIFGNGGGAEVRNSQLLDQLRSKLGKRRGLSAWRDLMEGNDPEAPTTTSKRFNYGRGGIGPRPGSIQVSADSLKSTATASSEPRRVASNFELISASHSATGHPLAVMGPQLGYYYPEIVLEADMHGPGIDARGALVPGGGPFVLIGRTRNYAWSLTSATNDNVDTWLLPTCRDAKHYTYRGRCRKVTTFDAGQLDGKPVTFGMTVHGPVQGTVRAHGKRYLIARQRSTYGQDANSIAALRDMTLGKASTPARFYRAANKFGFTFNWGYVSRKHIAYFSSGLLPRRAPGLDTFLPTLGTGKYDWRGFISLAQHPHQADPRSGKLLSWNNKPAPGWTEGDDVHTFGSVQRVQMFRGYGRKASLARVVGVMNRAATQDIRIERVWPVIRQVLGKATPPDALTGQAVALLDQWRATGGSRLDRDNDGKIDAPGAAIMDTAFPLLAHAAMKPALGSSLLDQLATVTPIDQAPNGRNGSSFASGWYEYLDKDLRTVLGRKVRGRFALDYCGGGKVAKCRASLFAALQEATKQLAAAQGPDPSAWRSDATAERIHFTPGVISDTMRWTNRPTFQQVVSFGAKP